MSMYCYQCQEALGGKACTLKGVCGKTPEVANLQDLLVYVLKGIAARVIGAKLDVATLGPTNRKVVESLFATITNANFDDRSIERQIRRMLALRDGQLRFIGAASMLGGVFLLMMSN